MKKLLISAIIFTMMAVLATSASAISGDGTKATPYIIENQKHLKMVTDQPDRYFKLGNDIVLDGTWVPLCKQSSSGYFTGVFDGAGHTISNLATDGSYGGLFKSNRGTIKNVKVIIAEGGTTGDSGIAYYNSGTITDCYVKGDITSSYDNTGGICAYNVGTISRCKFEGNIKNTSTKATAYTGGITGYNLSIVKTCAVIGNVMGGIRVGGVVGYNEEGSKIADCYFIGELSGKNYIGGIVGRNDYYYDSSMGNLTRGEVIDCYAVPKGATYGIGFNEGKGTGGYTARITTSYYDKEVSNLTDPEAGEPKSTEAMKLKETYESVWDFTNTWGINKNINDGYPYLLWEYPEVEEIPAYTLNSIQITDSQGNKLDAIPDDSFFFEIDVTKNNNSKDADYLIIAVYDKDGAFLDVKYMRGVYYRNQNLFFGAMLDGKNQDIGSIRAFVWNGVSGVTTLSNVAKTAE